jgi:membrane protein implicated in regulation of membrane protease activity
MAYAYQFEDHLREHGPSRLGQRLWWIPVAVSGGLVIADGVYLVVTPHGQIAAALALTLPLIAALLLLVGAAALSIADWTYPAEKYYREAQHTAACQARAYILAGRRAGDERPRPSEDDGTAGQEAEALERSPQRAPA